MTGILGRRSPDPILGHDDVEEILQAALFSGRLAHAYLFAGPGGTGRFSTALVLAASFMCRNSRTGWCGECGDCRRIMKLQHPDVRITFPVLGSTKPEEVADLISKRSGDGTTRLAVPGNSAIVIDAVREIQARMALKPYEGRGRVEILLDVDRMRQEASNALLKTLEEPPPETLLILTAERVSGVIPTVRSRAHLVRFGRVPAGTVTRILEERAGISPAEASRAAAMADGSVGDALTLAKEGPVLSDVVRRGLEMLTLAEPSGIIPAVRVMAKALGVPGSTSLCAGMSAILHDLRRLAVGSPAVFSTPQDLPPGRGWSADSLGKAVESFQVCESRIRANVNPAAALIAAFTGAWHVLGSCDEKRGEAG